MEVCRITPTWMAWLSPDPNSCLPDVVQDVWIVEMRGSEILKTIGRAAIGIAIVAILVYSMRSISHDPNNNLLIVGLWLLGAMGFVGIVFGRRALSKNGIGVFALVAVVEFFSWGWVDRLYLEDRFSRNGAIVVAIVVDEWKGERDHWRSGWDVKYRYNVGRRVFYDILHTEMYHLGDTVVVKYLTDDPFANYALSTGME